MDRNSDKGKVLLIQTPNGVVRVALDDPSMPPALARAFALFQRAIEQGAADPLADTMHTLNQMAAGGEPEPLGAALEFMRNLMEPAPTPSPGPVLSRLDTPPNLN